MKIKIVLLVFIVAFAFASCNTQQKSETKTNTTQTEAMYQCPMKCEGDKMYDKPGQCPVCNMDLKKVDGNHEHHEHDSTNANR